MGLTAPDQIRTQSSAAWQAPELWLRGTQEIQGGSYLQPAGKRTWD